MESDKEDKSEGEEEDDEEEATTKKPEVFKAAKLNPVAFEDRETKQARR
jgi:hypothetical protein